MKYKPNKQPYANLRHHLPVPIEISSIKFLTKRHTSPFRNNKPLGTAWHLGILLLRFIVRGFQSQSEPNSILYSQGPLYFDS